MATIDSTSSNTSLSHQTMNHGQPDHGDHPITLPDSPEGTKDIPQLPMTGDVSLAALQYLPTPLIILSPSKTIVLANEAMARLLGLRNRDEENMATVSSNTRVFTDMLRGQTLSQIGVEIMQDGVPAWVSWERFLDNLTDKLENEEREEAGEKMSDITSGETTPGATLQGNGRLRVDSQGSPMGNKALVHDTVVDVVVSTQYGSTVGTSGRNRHQKSRSPTHQIHAKMIISIWPMDDERFFSLSFTSTSPSQQKPQSQSHVVSRAPLSSSSSYLHSSSARSSTPTSYRSSSSRSSMVTSPTESDSLAVPFPPHGAPSKSSQAGAFTDFQKVTKMKEAMLSAMEIPVLAMWKDESVVFPNPAARKMLAVVADPTIEDSYDFISRFKAYTADFERELRKDEYPIASLCQNKKGFSNWKIGMIEPRSGKRRNYDVSGKPVFDEQTGDFFAGLVAFKDVTFYTDQIASQHAENEQQFQLICNSMPQMLWTTRPDGYHDYFSQRWYEYTGLSVSECYGTGWKLPFHPDDMPETVRRWQHSLATGDEYKTEYRCRRHDGEYRWMLGRALPQRDSKTGKTFKWFGSCTDIQEVRLNPFLLELHPNVACNI